MNDYCFENCLIVIFAANFAIICGTMCCLSKKYSGFYAIYFFIPFYKGIIVIETLKDAYLIGNRKF